MFVLGHLLKFKFRRLLRICSLLSYGFRWILIAAVDCYITTKISLDGKEFGDGLVTTDTLR